MLHLVSVTCPHCGAHGQIVVPPIGAIIIGPCPECEELVCIFCGKCLAIDKAIMINGTVAEQQAHLLSVLAQFVKESIDQMFSEDGPGVASNSSPSVGQQSAARGPITATEFSDFLRIDLGIHTPLDNAEQFHRIFDDPPEEVHQ